jgi:hypothetical protein
MTQEPAPVLGGEPIFSSDDSNVSLDDAALL